MFEGVFIGKLDVNNNKICVGDRVKFKCSFYENREFEGTVKYSLHSCQFIIDRDDNEGRFQFYSDVYNIKIIK